MNRLFKKENILTIPNLLSIIRLALIPIIMWLYLGKNNYIGVIITLLISGITDVIDGYVARHLNMVSDLGKILDPIADKLTQFSIILCLSVTYSKILGIAILFAIKEFCMIIFGYMTMKRKDMVNSAKWHGKLNTVVIYIMILLLIMFPNMEMAYVNILITISSITMLISFVLYALFYKKVLSDRN